MRNPTCDLCFLGYTNPKKPGTVCLMEQESVPCSVMLVAEQPSQVDDTYGVVFAGKALAEIRDYLLSKGVPGPIYCTYAIKCPKPNKDTKLTPQSVKTCSNTYLVEEIKAVKPKHIITLGSNAYYGVTKHRTGAATPTGNKYTYEALEAILYPTIHHAQAAYNEQSKAQLTRDLDRFAEWIQHGGESLVFDPPVYVATTLKSLRGMQRRIRSSGNVVAVDTETQGLNPFRKDKSVRCIQFCWDPAFGGVFVPLALEPDCYYTDTGDIAQFWTDEPLSEAIEIVREILLEAKCIWHNGKFDRLWLYTWGLRESGEPILAPNLLMDTMHMAHLRDENRRIGLKMLTVTELGFPSYDIPDKLTKNLDILIPYSTRDTVATMLIAQKYGDFTPDFKARLKLYKNLIRPADRLFTKIELFGWPVNGERVDALDEALDAPINDATARLDNYLDDRGIEHGEKAYSSTQQLSRILWEELGYKPNGDKSIAYTDSGRLGTGADAVLHLKGDPFIDDFLSLRGLAKARSTYVRPMREAVEIRGKITTSYKLTGTVTGRTASGKEVGSKNREPGVMNTQNLPYDRYGIDGEIAGKLGLQPNKKGNYTIAVRDCIKAQEGWSILELDFSQIELRVAGHLSQDPMFLDAYRQGQDVHALQAMGVMGVTSEDWFELPEEIRKEKRQNAKAVNFGYLYGMQARTFQQYALLNYGLLVSMDDCVRQHDLFYSDHPGLEPWYEQQEAFARKYGYVESLTGRRRHLPNIKATGSSQESKGKYNEAVRFAINMPVQSFASDLKLMSAIEIDPQLDSRVSVLIGEIHDSLVFGVRDDVIEEVALMGLNVMRHPKLLATFGIELSVPICGEAKAGVSLGEAKELKL